MTPEVQIALIAGIPATLTAAGALVAVIMASRRSQEADKTADAKLDQIHVLTNSNLTAANNRIDELTVLVRKMAAERLVPGGPQTQIQEGPTSVAPPDVLREVPQPPAPQEVVIVNPDHQPVPMKDVMPGGKPEAGEKS